MPTIKVMKQDGQVAKEINLNDSIFGIEPNKQALFDAVLLQRAALRQGTHDTKTRTEVRGGGRKPWRQKGTGRARQGSIRSPQWRGGGVVFGPTPREYNLKMNKKVRRLALKSALSAKFLEEGIVVVDTFSFDEMKTKHMVQALSALNVARKALIVVSEEEMDAVSLVARNIPTVSIMPATSVSVLQILGHDTFLATEAAINKIEEVLA